ncbi:MAG: hypothetical protein FWF69_06930 [Firmicutes bacterium]|nr:hypothetical protein [Bacillota bacterium]
MGITIGGWVLVAFGVICLFAGIGAASYLKRNQKGAAFASAVSGVLVAVLCVGGALIYSGTEAGKRAYKDQQSNFTGGIHRTLTIYDINGNVIKEYSGEFDVETTNERYILFDDAEGKRHIIYNTTGTVIVDEI